MKKGKVFFNPIEGSGTLTISWSSGPKGDAVEAKKGAGVGFFSNSGELLCVVFDEVQSSIDQQTLEFSLYNIIVTVKSSKVKYVVTKVPSKTLIRKKRAKRKQPI